VAPSLTEDVIWLKNWITQRLLWLDAQLNQFNVLVLGSELESPTSILFPNPTQAMMTVQCTVLDDGPVDVELIDLLGRIVYAKQFSGQSFPLFQQTLDLQSYSAGTYRIRVRQQARILFQGTCIKQN
jgi:hypothetical protein